MRKILTFTLLSLFCLAALSCKGRTAQGAARGKPVVIATTTLISDIARNLGGEFISVHTLMRYGADPHQYKASEGDVLRIAEAALILHNGLSFESKLDELLERAQTSILSYSVTADVPDRLFLAVDESYDPHVWFDPKLWIQAAQTMADGLVTIDPDNTLYYRKNEETYIAEIIEMDKEIRQLLATVPEKQRVLLTSHNAFGYLGRAYGWKTMSVQGLNTAVETSVNDVGRLAEEVLKSGVRCVFTETSVPSRKAEALISAVKSRNGELAICGELYSDTLGDSPNSSTYLEMYRTNARTISNGIRGAYAR